MAIQDADGMTRWDLEWEIQDKDGTRTGKHYELHEMELREAIRAIRKLWARRGNTVIIRVI